MIYALNTFVWFSTLTFVGKWSNIASVSARQMWKCRISDDLPFDEHQIMLEMWQLAHFLFEFLPGDCLSDWYISSVIFSESDGKYIFF